MTPRRRSSDNPVQRLCAIRRHISAALVAWVLLVVVVIIGFNSLEGATTKICEGQNEVRREVRTIVDIATRPDPSAPPDQERLRRAARFRQQAFEELKSIEC